jgi:hypothetical protein
MALHGARANPVRNARRPAEGLSRPTVIESRICHSVKLGCRHLHVAKDRVHGAVCDVVIPGWLGSRSAALAVCRSAKRFNVHLHEPLQRKLQRLFDKIGICILAGRE